MALVLFTLSSADVTLPPNKMRRRVPPWPPRAIVANPPWLAAPPRSLSLHKKNCLLQQNCLLQHPTTTEFGGRQSRKVPARSKLASGYPVVTVPDRPTARSVSGVRRRVISIRVVIWPWRHCTTNNSAGYDASGHCTGKPPAPPSIGAGGRCNCRCADRSSRKKSSQNFFHRDHLHQDA